MFAREVRFSCRLKRVDVVLTDDRDALHRAASDGISIVEEYAAVRLTNNMPGSVSLSPASRQLPQPRPNRMNENHKDLPSESLRPSE